MLTTFGHVRQLIEERIRLSSLIDVVREKHPDAKVVNTKRPWKTPPTAAQLPGPKPQGQWFGTGPSWLEFIDEENPQWAGPYTYVITLDTQSVLEISTPAQLLDFTRKYGVERGFEIDWSVVAQSYKGIDISPYISSMRLNPQTAWYYGWDVASGCVWDPSAITSVDQVDVP